ncbi:MAG: hypothetical protein ACTSR8_08740 [Promethearchaeota archaeon]
MVYDISFQDVAQGNIQLFGAFFSAIKSFISELDLKGSIKLNGIDLEDYQVFINHIDEIQVDFVIIADKNDEKLLNRMRPKIEKIILEHKELFFGWSNVVEFKVLDQPLLELISSKRKLVDEKALQNNNGATISSDLIEKSHDHEEIKQNLIAERKILMERWKKIRNLNQKVEITKKLIEISDKLRDHNVWTEWKRKLNEVQKELSDLKIKMRYFLTQTKDNLTMAIRNLGNNSLKSGNYRDVYSNLYSFCSKLKRVSDAKTYYKYLNLTKILADKEDISDEEFSRKISEISAMSDTIEDYFLHPN